MSTKYGHTVQQLELNMNINRETHERDNSIFAGVSFIYYNLRILLTICKKQINIFLCILQESLKWLWTVWSGNTL
jgi:hypothetical protein